MDAIPRLHRQDDGEATYAIAASSLHPVASVSFTKALNSLSTGSINDHITASHIYRRRRYLGIETNIGIANNESRFAAIGRPGIVRKYRLYPKVQYCFSNFVLPDQQMS